MNKATPIPDTIQVRSGGTMEIANCIHDGGKITRARTRDDNRFWSWWHVATSRIYCAEKP